MRMQSRLTAVVALFTVISVFTSAQLDVTCYTNSGAVLSTPATASWATDRSVFNEKIDVQPAAVAYAYNEDQVKAIVQCTKASGLEVVPKGGSHGYEGYAVQAGKVILDVSNITFFQVAADGQTATFGSGLRLGQLFLHMYLDANSLFPAGLCPWVGTAGHLLGGGTGLNTRQYGLACDQIVELTMLDATGNLIVANSAQNQDLLWASCGGGGGNLGIVTSYKVKLHSLNEVPTVTTIKLNWPGYDHAVDVFDLVQKWAPSADPRLGVQVYLGSGSTQISMQWLGSQSDAETQLNNSGLPGVPGLSSNDIKEQSWINATLLWGADTMGISDDSIYNLNMTNGPPSRNSFQASSSYNQQPMSREGIQAMVNAITPYPNNAYVEHKILAGATAAVGPTDTAFYYRNSIFETQWMYYWSDGDQEGAANQWLSNTLATMKPYIGEGAYINYPDPLLAQTQDWPQAYYGGNLDRYTQVKTKYDPTNFFNNPLTVKPTQSQASPSPAAQLTPAFSPASSPTPAPAPISSPTPAASPLATPPPPPAPSPLSTTPVLPVLASPPPPPSEIVASGPSAGRRAPPPPGPTRSDVAAVTVSG